MRRTALALAAASFLIALRQLRQGWGPRPRLRDARWVRAHGADPNPDGQLTALKAWLIRLLGLRRQPLKLQQPSAKPPSTKDDGLTSRERARAHLKFGNICARSCNLEKALKHYASASLIDPTFAAPRYNCAGVCQRLRRFEEAVEHYEAALMLKPHGVEAATNVVVAHMNAGQQAAASGNMSASVAHYSAAVAKCYRALQIQEAAFDAGGRGTQSRFNSEAFANLNIALRLLGKNQEAIDRTWAQLALLARSSLNPSAAPLLAEDERRTTDAVRPPAVELPALSHCLAKSSRAGLRSVSSGPSDILTVVCVKWGDVYGPEYVNRLYAMVRRNLGQGIDADCKPGASSSVSNPLKLRFVCLTDNPVNLRAEVEPLPIPPSAVSWQGWWLKACLFSSNLPIEGRVLYLDLDTVSALHCTRLACRQHQPAAQMEPTHLTCHHPHPRAGDRGLPRPPAPVFRRFCDLIGKWFQCRRRSERRL
eukprot:scaffold270876_cov31-Tisochrysis_lutea.AAC.2